MKRLICFLSIFILLAGIAIPSFAATSYKPVITVYKYNDATDKYDIADPASATNGDLIMVKVAFDSAVPSLASLRLKVEYSQETVSYVDGSFTPELVTGNSNAGNPIFTSKDGYFVALFSSSNTSGDVEIAQNVTNVASFIFNCIGANGTIEFKATLDNALDKDYKDIPLSGSTVSKTLSISAYTMSAEYLAVFQKLADMVYSPENEETDSKKDIELADKIYNGYEEFDASTGKMVTVYPGLSAAEKIQFKNSYPELFEYYQTAWTRYYDAALNASEESVNAEVANFKAENANALAVAAPEEVTTSNYQDILNALDAYKKLTTKAKLKLTNEKSLLDSLKDAADAIAASLEADAYAIQSFINDFEDTLWKYGVDDVNDETYGAFMTITASAESAYDGLEHDILSSSVKSKIEACYQKLQQMKAKVSEVAKLNGESEAIQDEISAFTSKWYNVMKLNALTVGIGDETALKMMLEDYELLSDTAKERLASQKKSAEQLLQLTKELNTIQDEQGDSEITVVPQGTVTNTVEVIKETEVPVEVEKVVNKFSTAVRNVPKIVYIIVILMGAAILSVFVPITMYIIYKKKHSDEMGGN